jgi:hypothetical protein
MPVCNSKFPIRELLDDMFNTLMAYYHGIEAVITKAWGFTEEEASEIGTRRNRALSFSLPVPTLSVSSSGKQAGKPDTGGGPPD